MGYAKRILQRQISKNSKGSKKNRSNMITYTTLLKDALSVNECKKNEFKEKGNTSIYHQLVEKLDRMAALAQRRFHIESEDFYNDLYNMSARINRHSIVHKKTA